jgi:hypothetical protein
MLAILPELRNANTAKAFCFFSVVDIIKLMD